MPMRPWPQARDGAVDVAEPHRREDGDVTDLRRVGGEGRPEEDADGHGARATSLRARAPGVYPLTPSFGPSSPGTTTRTTGRPSASLPRSTAITWSIPVARHRVSSQSRSSFSEGAVKDGTSSKDTVGGSAVSMRRSEPQHVEAATPGSRPPRRRRGSRRAYRRCR